MIQGRLRKSQFPFNFIAISSPNTGCCAFGTERPGKEMAPGCQRNWGGVNSPWKILGQRGFSCIVTHVLYKWKYHTQKPPSYESCLCCTILQFFMWYVYWVKHPSDGLETKKMQRKNAWMRKYCRPMPGSWKGTGGSNGTAEGEMKKKR